MTKVAKSTWTKPTKEIIILSAPPDIWYNNYLGEVFDAVEYDNAWVINEKHYVRKEDCALVSAFPENTTLMVQIEKIRYEINN